MNIQKQDRHIIALRLSRRQGGHVMRYAEVDAPTYQRWIDLSKGNDFITMKQEAPRLLRKRLSEAEAAELMPADTLDGYRVFTIPGMVAEDLFE